MPSDAIVNAWSHDDDGAGYCFVNEFDCLVIRKPFFKLKKLLHAYAADYQKYGASSPFVVHCRFSTHGTHNKVNTHPHSICGGEVALVHNGILSDFLPPMGKDISDTVFFCRSVLEYRATEHVMDNTFKAILGKMIGRSNKFIMLDKNKNVSIVNEDSGVWDNGCWFSNADYKLRYVASTYTYTPTTEKNCCFPGTVPATIQTVDGSQKFIGRHGDIVTYGPKNKSALPAAYQDDLPWDGYTDVKNMSQSDFEHMLESMTAEEIIDYVEFDDLNDEQWRMVAAKLEVDEMDKQFERSLL